MNPALRKGAGFFCWPAGGESAKPSEKGPAQSLSGVRSAAIGYARARIEKRFENRVEKESESKAPRPVGRGALFRSLRVLSSTAERRASTPETRARHSQDAFRTRASLAQQQSAGLPCRRRGRDTRRTLPSPEPGTRRPEPDIRNPATGIRGAGRGPATSGVSKTRRRGAAPRRPATSRAPSSIGRAPAWHAGDGGSSPPGSIPVPWCSRSARPPVEREVGGRHPLAPLHDAPSSSGRTRRSGRRKGGSSPPGALLRGPTAGRGALTAGTRVRLPPGPSSRGLSVTVAPHVESVMGTVQFREAASPGLIGQR